MKNLEHWNEVTMGLYRYIIAAKACYEIHILYHSAGTDIMTAKASAYIVGEWASKENKDFIERECLLSEQTVSKCLEAVVKDYEGNMG